MNSVQSGYEDDAKIYARQVEAAKKILGGGK